MEKELIFALISTGIYLIGAIPLWRDIIRTRTIPHPFTYTVWLILVWFNVYVLLWGWEVYSLIPTTLMVFSLVFGTIWGIRWIRKIFINWFDYLCIFLSVVLIIYWVIERNTLNTVILTVAIDILAFLPTFKKWWLQPWTESILVYFMSAVGQVFTILSLSQIHNLESSLFWWYLFFANLTFFVMVFFRRWYLRWRNSIFE